MPRSVRQDVPELDPGKGAQTVRGEKRRDLILKVAAELFAESSFSGVSINQIGIAAGISGPAIYRYFSTKEALLVSVFEHLIQRNIDGMQAVLADDLNAWKTLERLIDLQLMLALEEPEKIRIVSSETRHLPLKEGAYFRAESRRQLSVWIDVVGRVRPDLPRFQCEVTVHGVLAMINSIANRRGEDWDAAGAREHLRAMVLGAVSADEPTVKPEPESA